ncbi:MAG TPA: hypothetical protein VMW75_27825 [Thermoanaerobaculia bacterium]|nr:hypothetical protein [Thermoanaerobaculia bacterium]
MRRLASCILALALLPHGAAATPGLATGPLIAVGTGAHPHAAALPAGGFVVVWEAAPDHGPATPNTLHARLFDARGVAIGGEIELVRPVGQALAGVAALPSGFVVVWEQDNAYGASSVFARRFDLTGAALGRPFKVHRNSSVSRCCAEVAAAPGGGFVVGWSAFSDIRSGNSVVLTRFFDAAGNPLGPPPPDPKPVSIEDASGDALVALAVDPSGVLNSIVLDVADAATLLWRGKELDPDADFAPEYDVAASFAADGDFVLARATGDPFFAYTFPSAIVARRFSGSDGSPLGASVQLSHRQGWEVQPAVAVLPDGRFVAVWNEVASRQLLGTLFARAWNGDGTPATHEQYLSTSAAAAQGQAALTVQPDGTVIAVWQEAGKVTARLLRLPSN